MTPEQLERYNATSYPEMVQDLCKPGSAIVSSLMPDQAHVFHMAVGVAGESGELLDAIKKHTIYNKTLDRENVVEELGDLEFYMEGLRQGLDITRAETLETNKMKLLGKRYASGSYSDTQAIARADKAED